ncbi:flagellar hook-length control protein FliK [Undibacterium sp. Ren11W]|uniref:flagellar hook-length control protein FliK n=1 Tax=Undibacterium sp. Ren11W TaxID=3413045 RepID=UPI003BF3C159
MKTSAIFANNETQSITNKALKLNANSSTQGSFNHFYSKEISNKNSTASTQKSEQQSSATPKKLEKKPSYESNETTPNVDQVTDDKDSEVAALPATETNLGIISLLANTSQLTSTLPTEVQSKNAELSITDVDSRGDLSQKITELDASELVADTQQGSASAFSQIGEPNTGNQSKREIIGAEKAGKIDGVGAQKLITDGTSDGNSLAIGEELEKHQITNKSTIADGLEKHQAALKSAKDLDQTLQHSSSEKKLNQLETQFDRTLEAQARSSASSKELQVTPDNTTPSIQSLAQSTLLSNTPEAIVATKTALTPHVGANGWDRALGQKVVWMIAGGLQSAELSLNPPDLGPLQVVIRVSNDQASTNFFSAQPEVREALEAALPRLRQMLSDAGVQLSDFSVGTQASQQGNAFSDGRSNTQRSANTTNSSTAAETIISSPLPTKILSKQGLVDTFA